MNKKLLLYNSLLLSILFVTTNKGVCQEDPYSSRELIESLVLVSDREVYCAGETILFSAFNTSDTNIEALALSHVMYVEIVSPTGQAVAQQKYRFSSGISSGQIHIPSSILTGTYYLKAYTKWMRNFSPYAYFYKPIRVLNPNNANLLQNILGQTKDTQFTYDSLLERQGLEIQIPREHYGKRENISIEVSSELDFPSDLSVSIAKEGLSSSRILNMEYEAQEGFQQEYVPETRGLSISGRIIRASDSSAVSFNPVQLTLFTANPKLYTAVADKTGRFNIALPGLEGKYELFLSSNITVDNEDPSILIDNDFCTRKVFLPFIPFSIANSERSLLNEICLNHQIETGYLNEEDSLLLPATYSMSAFYGRADYIVKLVEYIELPSLQDYIHELMPGIIVRQKNKKKYLKVYGDYSDLSFNDPLVLLDMVPVKDITRILAIPPKHIDRVEVIGVPYIRGNQMYGGIVSFFSKQGDLAGIELPEWGNFIQLNFYSDQQAPLPHTPADNRTPDLRNTLYWNPSFSLKPHESRKLNLTTSDLSGRYIILIRGIDEKGNQIFRSSHFDVK